MQAKRRGPFRHLGTCLLAAACLAALAAPAQSAADTPIGGHGSEAGQTLDPTGLAIDQASELLYVADSGNHRVSVFDASTGAFVRAFGWGVADGVSEELQICTSPCFQGLEGSGSGQFKRMAGIAVDNDPGSPAFHDVYVFERTPNIRVQRLTPAGEFVWMVGGGVNETSGEDLCTAASGDSCAAGEEGSAEGSFNSPQYGAGVAVGPGGILHVHDRVGSGVSAESRVQKYEPSGAYLEQMLLPVAGGSGNATATGVDSEGNIYLGTAGAQGAVRKYDPSGTELYALSPSFNDTSLAVDEADHVFISDSVASPPGTAIKTTKEYDSTGTQLRAFYNTSGQRQLGLARLGGTESIFSSEQDAGFGFPSRLAEVGFPAAGPAPALGRNVTVVTDIGSTRAAVRSFVNPENAATTYRFDYISDADYVAAGETFGTGTLSTPEEPLPGPVDFEAHEVEAELPELFPETVYHFRVTATSADGGPNSGPTLSFETKEPIEYTGTWATEVGTDRATLHVEANPLGLAATGRFQIVAQASFEESGFAEAMEAPPAGSEAIDLGEGETAQTHSAQLFSLTPGTEYRYRFLAENRCEPEPAPLCQLPGPERTLRTFAPPPGKVTGCPNDAMRLGFAGFLPDCRGYEMVSPVDKNGANVEAAANIGGLPASLDQAAADGGSISYSTYKAFGEVASAPYSNQYLARRGGGGWASEAISPLREGPSIMTYGSAQLDRQYKYFSEDLCQGWVVQDANPVLAEGGIAGYGGLYRRENCEPGLGDYEAITRVEAPIVDPELENRQFVPELQGASADGEVAFFQVPANLTAGAPPQPAGCDVSASCEMRLYEAREGKLKLACILPNGSAWEGDCGAGRQGGSGERTGTVARAVSADGSRVFWADSVSSVVGGVLYVRIDGTETIQMSTEAARFETAAADGSKAVYSVGSELFEFDVDSETETPIAGGFGGVAGASEDASRIYLTSTEDLAAGAVEGQPNLYLYEAGVGFRLVATLRSADGAAGIHPADSRPERRVSRVSADGERIAFMWGGSLTGYDNLDAASGEKDQEVFLYDASAEEGEGRLRCISCNPTGARPAGRVVGELAGTIWAAAWFPVWESQLHGQRLLSEDGGRLYFNSFEALVPRDVNGKQDVYQWEAEAAGSCTTSDPGFDEATDGCLSLISSGQGKTDSEIVEIGADGGDVFFKTESSLVGQDKGLVDIYDARVDGGFPEPPPPPGECEGEACQSPAGAPQAQTPSSTVAGPGNVPYVKPKKPRRCAKGKRKVKRKGKVRCVKKKVQRNQRRHNRVHPNRRAGR